ncbi:magnesium chelatase [Anaeroselena agilis]|uniref:Magnesium chelatase n=1 Tax=Anaeroselena agilis TaxID=3063788 RepID=A0ABU3NXQ6_9FIRM|nr:magnesium chelatase [Selenomonadales bacterium 4137-cl]
MYNRLVRHNGNNDLFRAVELSAAALTSRHPFHLHAEGLRGTGKTTILRAAASQLPPIVRVRGCVYNCHPAWPHCPEHKGLDAAAIERIGREIVPCPFLEISQSAKVGTVLGSIDLARLVDRRRPAAALLPGTILQAHRGVVFIDEVNRLADTGPELVDVLLDVMGTKPGRVQVEETGLPVVEMPVEVTVWAASNPDEEPGALAQVRRQLADRFDLVVNMGRPSEYRAVTAMLAKREGEASQVAGAAGFRLGDFRGAEVGDELRTVLASIYIDFNLESLRAIEGLETAARLAAIQAGRRKVLTEDVALVAPLVLGHRTDNATLAGILKYLQALDGKREAAIEAVEPGKPQAKARTEPTEAGGATSRWGRWWEEFRRRLAAGRPKREAAEGSGAAQGTTGGGAASTASGIADPTHAVIVAPPCAAVPLSELPADKYVGGEDSNSHV